MELNSDEQLSMSLSTAGALPHSTLLVIIIVPVVSVIFIILIIVMFCLYWRRKKAVQGISEKKIREKLDKFKQRKLESQREMSISTICNDTGDGRKRFRASVKRKFVRSWINSNSENWKANVKCQYPQSAMILETEESGSGHQ